MTSNTNKTDELSDEAFCALLMNGAPDDNAEADELKGALASYRSETLLWAERRSAAMPSLAQAARKQRVWAAAPQWALAAVAAVTVAVGVVHMKNASQQTASIEAPSAMVAEPQTAAQQLADDNALLSSIDAAVHAGSGLPVNALGLGSMHGAARPHGSME